MAMSIPTSNRCLEALHAERECNIKNNRGNRGAHASMNIITLPFLWVLVALIMLLLRIHVPAAAFTGQSSEQLSWR